MFRCVRVSILLLLSVFAILIFGCSSLQEVSMSVELTAQSEDIHRIEEKFSTLDAKRLLGEDKSEDYVSSIKELMTDIDKVLAIPGLQLASKARIQALKGLAYLLQGNKGKALDCHKNAVAAYKGDAQGFILGKRLGVVTEEDMAACDEKALIELQKAIECFESNNFTDSVAKFDAAFLGLPEYYRNSYLCVRDEAWRLRLIDSASGSDSNVMKILKQNEITVGQLLILAQQSTNLLFKTTGDKRYNEKDLFKVVSSSSTVLNPVSGNVNTVLSQGDVVTRILCARILWNLYCELKGIPNTKYSSAYRSAGIPSPVSDLDLSSADFDAVLGCVENEVMSLVDGEKFDVEKSVSGAEADEFLKNVK